eukprot:13051854-Alexandrium_andersonii.AAC.1
MVAAAHREAVVDPCAMPDGPREQEVVRVHVHAVVLAHLADECACTPAHHLMALLCRADGLVGADGRRLHEHVQADLPLDRVQHVLQSRLGVAT